MGRINVTDEWLYQYMPLVNENIIRELEEQTGDGCQFSEQFEDNMKKIIRKEKRMGRRKNAKTRAVAAAACMAVFLSAAVVNVYGDKILWYSENVMGKFPYLFLFQRSRTRQAESQKAGLCPVWI